jgi:hypothetical protein
MYDRDIKNRFSCKVLIATTGTITTLTATTINGNTLYNSGLAFANDVTVSAGKNFTMDVGGAGTFTTATGTNTLSGNVVIAAAKNLTMSGASTFTTGTGAVSLNGDVTIAAAKNLAMSGAATFTTGTGAVAINGTMTIATAKTLIVTDADKLTVGAVIVPQAIEVAVPINAATVDEWVFMTPLVGYTLTAVREIHTVASAGGTTVDIKKTAAASTTAPTSGTTMLNAVIPMDSTANIAQSPALTGTGANLVLAVGDKVGIHISATLTGLVGGIIMLTFKRS